MPDSALLNQVLRYWDLQAVEFLPDNRVQGSPERSLFRTVVRDTRGDEFILEQLEAEAQDLKTTIARRVDRLARNGLAVAPYCAGTDGDPIQRHGGFCWQLAPLVRGTALDRETYWDEHWRGQAAGRFLTHLHAATNQWEVEAPVFSLPDYIHRLVEQIERHNPECMPRVKPLAAFLEHEFQATAGDIPVAFCHGDPHPLNMIWKPDGIAAVIDWEFCGWKPMLYDAALIIGCVGAEAPAARNGGFITGFLNVIWQDAAYTADVMDRLPMFVLAVRFGWLAEWLRKHDREMIEFELFYMDLLMDACHADT